jgi:TonB family protein
MIKNEEETPKEAEPADTAPSTGVVSSGPADNFGLRAKGGNGRRNVTAASPMSLWAPYASQAATRIAEAMRHHSRLKSASMQGIRVRVWIDAAGRITRATTQSTGDAALDSALQNEVLTGMQLSGPPPEGMKMPVNLKVTARRP